MVGRGEGAGGRARRDPALAQHLERGRRAVLQEMAVDIEQGLAVLTLDDDVRAPDLVEQGRMADDRLPASREAGRRYAGFG